ncbi:MAG TPA: phasin family protein [Methylosinus sp.]|jgi:hypothetical protein
MATHFKGPAKPRATQKLAPISLKDELEADEPIEAPADVSFPTPAESDLVAEAPLERAAVEAVTPVEILAPAAAEPAEAPEEPAVVIAAMTATLAPPALLAPEAAAAAASAPAVLDPSALPLKTLDLFNENAAAVLDFALALGAAKSVGDAFELQSRFASERYSSLVRQAGEFAELTRRLAFQNNPVKLSFSAFIA